MQAAHALRQKCRPKHQVLILKCYPKTTKGAIDVKPNSSELSYLLYYATTRRSKVQKVGEFLEKKTASDVWRARIGNVQVTLQILAALIEKAPRDLPLYAPYVLRILNIILRNHDITMVEASIPTFAAFCDNHDGASLSADQEYLRQYEEIVKTYTHFASTRSSEDQKKVLSAPLAMRWRNVGLQAIRSVTSSEALSSVAGRQLHVIVPILLENLWTDNEDFIDLVEHRAQLEQKEDTEKSLRRRTSIATVRTADISADAALSRTTADADKVAEEDIGVSAMQCLQQIFVANNRAHINLATAATLDFIAERVSQGEPVVDAVSVGGKYQGWAIQVSGMIARWTPVQDRYVILVSAMDTMIRGSLTDDSLMQQLVLATMIDSLLKSDANLIGLSVMDVLLGLIQHVLRVLQLDSSNPSSNEFSPDSKEAYSNGNANAAVPSNIRKTLLDRLQECMADLATHIYYADQISDMVSAFLLRLKPSPLSGVPNATAAIENPVAAASALVSGGDFNEDPNTDGFFSFDTAKIKALEAIKAIILVASNRKNMTGGGGLARNRVPVRVWEGTQWLLRDADGRVRKAYVDALLTWMDLEMTKADARAFEDKPKGLTKTSRDDSTTSLSKRAVSNASASHRDKVTRTSRTTFLQLLHLAAYENALSYVDSEADIVLLHLLLASLVEKLGVNAVKNGLPMIFRLQEDILDAETPMAKIRLGSLCHGYFWALSEKFGFDTSPTGNVVHSEIQRRRAKGFWVNSIQCPPARLDRIGIPGQDISEKPRIIAEVESEALKPFDDRFQMVKFISLSYAESISQPAASPPTSPGRSFTHPILSSAVPYTDEDRTMPEKIKDQMMSEWTREFVIATVQEGSKTVSLNGSKAPTNATGPRNFLAVNSSGNGGGNIGTWSPHSHRQGSVNQKNVAGSTYGLVGGLGALQKIRKGSAYSPSRASESSRNSVTRVDQLKRVLSGQQSNLPGTRGASHSDVSSDSMVSYDAASDMSLSFNPTPQHASPPERKASVRTSHDRTRSRSRNRNATSGGGGGEHFRPLTSNPVLTKTDINVPISEDLDAPPVPPIPAGVMGEGTAVHDHAFGESLRKGRSVRRGERRGRNQSIQSSLWGEDGQVPAVDLESLLNGIETEGSGWKGNVAKPPY